MAKDKDLERRIAVLEEQLESLANMLVDQGTVREQQKNILDELSKDIKRLSDYRAEEKNLPFVSFEWNPALTLWRVQLNNVDDLLKDLLRGDVSVIHEHPAQAFDMLLQKLQRKVS